MSWDDDTPDAALLQAWRDGDKTAADHLIARYGPRLYNFFASKVTDGVDELCRQTLHDCETTREAIEPDGSAGSVRGLVFATARRHLLKHFAHEGGSSLDPAAHSVADLNPGASEMMAAREQQRQLLLALRQLPLDAQVALELQFWEGLTEAEIATVVQAPVAAVSDQLSRAQRALREQIAKEREHSEYTVDALMTEDERRRR